ncbi:MAG: hypothetical protein GX444_17770 [Myxococcales bacterium]|nr:hypothetical protein [Myxococcales bacterium]
MRTIRRLVWCLGIFGLLAGPAWAGTEPIQFGGWGGISPGARYFAVADMNDYFESVNVDSLPPVWPVIGAQANGLLFEWLVVGGRGAWMKQSLNGGLSDVTLTVASGEMDVGYAVLNGRYGLAYPYVGLGGGASTLRFEQDGYAVRAFTEVDRRAAATASEPQDDLVYRKDVMIGSLGFTYLWPVRFVESETHGGFGAFLPGVTLGAQAQLLETGWRKDGKLARGGPDWSLTGAFLQLEINFGGGTVKRPAPEH